MTLKSLSFSDLEALTAKSENKKKAFQHQRRARINGTEASYVIILSLISAAYFLAIVA